MIVLALGANMESRWGAAVQTMRHAIQRLETNGVSVHASSSCYESAPLGVKAQPAFVNAVVLARTALGTEALLTVLKTIEREAGRSNGVPWGPRPLDIDIIDYAGRVMNWTAARPRALAPEGCKSRAMQANSPQRITRRRRLVIPHPQLHLRAFVLAPLAEVAPRWHHPVTGEPVARLLHAVQGASLHGEGRVIRIMHSGLT